MLMVLMRKKLEEGGAIQPVYDPNVQRRVCVFPDVSSRRMYVVNAEQRPRWERQGQGPSEERR